MVSIFNFCHYPFFPFLFYLSPQLFYVLFFGGGLFCFFTTVPIQQDVYMSDLFCAHSNPTNIF